MWQKYVYAIFSVIVFICACLIWQTISRKEDSSRKLNLTKDAGVPLQVYQNAGYGIQLKYPIGYKWLGPENSIVPLDNNLIENAYVLGAALSEGKFVAIAIMDGGDEVSCRTIKGVGDSRVVGVPAELAGRTFSYLERKGVLKNEMLWQRIYHLFTGKYCLEMTLNILSKTDISTEVLDKEWKELELIGASLKLL